MNKYVSIDIETTGLNPDKHQILEFGAVIDDGSPIDDCPTFRMMMKYDQISGSPYALALNSKLLFEMAEPGTRLQSVGELPHRFRVWLRENGLKERIVVAGKNYANFDLRFLEKLKNWKWINFSHRIIDVGNIYWDPKGDDIHLPDLTACLYRARLNTVVTHRAIDDAKQVIELIRAKL